MFVRIETSSDVPITRQIMDQIRTQCVSGALSPHERLPSVRELARELAVNQNTILRVYERLTGEGLLERRHGDGTYVAARPVDQREAQRQLLSAEIDRLARRAIALNVSADELCDLLRGRYESCVTSSAPAHEDKGKPDTEEASSKITAEGGGATSTGISETALHRKGKSE